MHVGNAEGVDGKAFIGLEEDLGAGSIGNAAVIKQPGHKGTHTPEQLGLLGFRQDFPMCMGQMASSLSWLDLYHKKYAM
jgi:hypothetical protein